jgi:hypothetical protein
MARAPSRHNNRHLTWKIMSIEVMRIGSASRALKLEMMIKARDNLDQHALLGTWKTRY